MPPSMLPDSAGGSGDPPVPGPSRKSRSRPSPVSASAPAPASAPSPTEAAPSAAAPEPTRGPAPAAADDSVTPRKASASRTRKAHEQRIKLTRQASALLKFVSDPTRLQVLMILTQGEHHVGALCEQLGHSQPAVSHHLALLRHGGVIIPRRAGKNNYYSLSDTGRELARVAQILIQAG